MENTATITPIVPAPALAGLSRTGSLAGLAALAFLWFILCRHLSHEWSANEQYSYGWFVPFFAAFSFWLRWEDRPAAGRKEEELRSKKSASLFLLLSSFLLLFLLLPVRLFELGNPDWRPLGWMHAAIVAGITLLFLRQIGGRPWVRHFAFPVAFIFVAVPWVTPIEGPIVQGLMRIVAGIATETIALFGVPAQLEGSVIRISSGVVGVNEACSGVRSLQTSLMIGLLFGELNRLSLRRRFALVAAAAGIAFLANCARTLFLVWIASERGVGAVDQWHDLAGYAILGAVFLGTIGLATLLARSSRQKIADKADAPSPMPIRDPISHLRSLVTASLLWLIAVEASAEAWYRVHERNLVPTSAWSVRWPENVAGFRELPINDTVRTMLRFDQGRQAIWPITVNTAALNTGGTSSMFFFRWEPNTTNILRARTHRPDICLPFTGWRMTADHGVHRYAVNAKAELPFRHFTFTRPLDGTHAVTAHTFFCEREDRIPRAETDRFDFTESATGTWSRADRVRVVRNGIRNQGQQVLEVVLVTQPELSGEAAQAHFAQLVPQIVEVGKK